LTSDLIASLNDSYSLIDFKGIGKFGTGPEGVAADGREALMAASCLRVNSCRQYKPKEVETFQMILKYPYKTMMNKLCNLPSTEPHEAPCASTNSLASLLKSRLWNWPDLRNGEIVEGTPLLSI
jgi:hypothetical protein